MSRPLAFVLLALTLGCQRVQRSKPGGTLRFRNCQITQRTDDGTAINCDCKKFTYAVDAQTKQTYILCSGEAK